MNDLNWKLVQNSLSERDTFMSDESEREWVRKISERVRETERNNGWIKHGKNWSYEINSFFLNLLFIVLTFDHERKLSIIREFSFPVSFCFFFLSHPPILSPLLSGILFFFNESLLYHSFFSLSSIFRSLSVFLLTHRKNPRTLHWPFHECFKCLLFGLSLMLFHSPPRGGILKKREREKG